MRMDIYFVDLRFNNFIFCFYLKEKYYHKYSLFQISGKWYLFSQESNKNNNFVYLDAYYCQQYLPIFRSSAKI